VEAKGGGRFFSLSKLAGAKNGGWVNGVTFTTNDTRITQKPDEEG